MGGRRIFVLSYLSGGGNILSSFSLSQATGFGECFWRGAALLRNKPHPRVPQVRFGRAFYIFIKGYTNRGGIGAGSPLWRLPRNRHIFSFNPNKNEGGTVRCEAQFHRRETQGASAIEGGGSAASIEGASPLRPLLTQYGYPLPNPNKKTNLLGGSLTHTEFVLKTTGFRDLAQ